jgi:glycosyltransferase 2 family protein
VSEPPETPTPGTQLFASARAEPRSRRPTDVALAIGAVVGVAITWAWSASAAGFDAALDGLLAEMPGFLDPLWRLAFWAPIVHALVLLVVATVRRRLTLTRDLLLAAVLAMLFAAAVVALAMDDGRTMLELLTDVDGPPVLPPTVSAVAVAVIATASPHLSRPMRHLGRWLIGTQVVASLFLTVADLSGALAGVGIGYLAAALVHLMFGSPGGRPSTTRIRGALADLGVTMTELEPPSMLAQGQVVLAGADVEGPLIVKVYGRDAWDAQVITDLWRWLWYRGANRTARSSRIELVEHEAFATLMAERAGVRTARVVTAGSAGSGDALIVSRPAGTPLGLDQATTDTTNLDVGSLWDQLEALHRCGLVLGQVDIDRFVVGQAGEFGFGDLSTASVVRQPGDRSYDRAQALMLALVLQGEDAAVATARAALGDEALAEALPYLQGPGVPPLLRRVIDRRKIRLDAVRKRTGELIGVEEPELAKLQRVTWKSLVGVALGVVAVSSLLGLFADIDMEAFLAALRDAHWGWLLGALVIAQAATVPTAIGTLGSTTQVLPLGPLVTLQFAIAYINLAIPSTAARVAVNMRFLNKFGLTTTAAASAGVIETGAGLLVELGLMISTVLLADLELQVIGDGGDESQLSTVVLIVVVAVLVVFLVPSARARISAVITDVRSAATVLRNPVKLLQLFGGNLLNRVALALALGACVMAFGYDVSVAELIFINTAVALFAGLLPIPGGVGVAEAGLTLGLTWAGVPEELALPSALAYRFVTFYLPPLWGWFSYRWLTQHHYL